MRILLPALGLMLLAPPAGAAEPVGRLFFTPDQRASLDAARSKRTRTAVATEKTDEVAAPPPGPEVVSYDGLVRRSDGGTTVWLNNRAVSEKEAAESKLVRRLRPDGAVTLQGQQSGRNVTLKVGERAELLSGTIEEPYQRRPTPKPETASAPAAGEKPQAGPAVKAAADAGGTVAEDDRKKAERDEQRKLEDAIREVREAAIARSAGTAPPPAGTPQEQAYPVMPR